MTLKKSVFRRKIVKRIQPSQSSVLLLKFKSATQNFILDRIVLYLVQGVQLSVESRPCWSLLPTFSNEEITVTLIAVSSALESFLVPWSVWLVFSVHKEPVVVTLCQSSLILSLFFQWSLHLFYSVCLSSQSLSHTHILTKDRVTGAISFQHQPFSELNWDPQMY